MKCFELLVEKGVIKENEKFEDRHLTETKLIEAVKLSFDEIAKFSKFNSLERPSNYILTNEEFSIANNLLTPTMKLVRKKIEKRYEKEIEKAYG
jgi:long-chain acyl-CoA synthetase